MSVSIPTSLFGVVSFILVAVFLFGEMDYSGSGSLDRMTTDVNYNFQNIQNIRNNQTESTSWGDSVVNAGAIFTNTFTIILNYVILPFEIAADLIISIATLPEDIAPIISAFLFVGLMSGIAIFIRGG